jgi:hypothetical protein
VYYTEESIALVLRMPDSSSRRSQSAMDNLLRDSKSKEGLRQLQG